MAHRSATDAARELLKRWVSAELYRISDTSSNMNMDYLKLMGDAAMFVADMSLEWDGTVIPDYVWDALKESW